MKHKLLATLLLLLPLLSAGPPADAAAEGWLTSVAEAQRLAREQNRRILVDLYADWCGWCKKLEQNVFTTPEFRAFARDYVLLQVDVEDGGEGSALQARHGAVSLPTTLILDAHLARVGEVTGYAPAAQYIEQIRRQAALWDEFLQQYERFRNSDELTVLRTLAEELHSRGDGERAAFLYERMREKVAPGTAGAAWVHFLLADSYRMSEDFPRAESALGRAFGAATQAGDPDLVERIDLLRFQIAQDRGDCKAALASLESFLTNHPRSSRSRQARRTLDALRSGDGALCT